MSSKSARFSQLYVRVRPGHPTQGLLRAGNRTIRSALGKSGVGICKREGDGKTPIGRFRLLSACYRTARIPLRSSVLPAKSIRPEHGWCDAPGDRNYNRPVNLPYAASHERLMRDDHLYDVLIVMDHNISRRLSVGGSAIFFHLAHDDYRPTEGCVAVSRFDMLWLLKHIGPKTRIIIG